MQGAWSSSSLKVQQSWHFFPASKLLSCIVVLHGVSSAAAPPPPQAGWGAQQSNVVRPDECSPPNHRRSTDAGPVTAKIEGAGGGTFTVLEGVGPEPGWVPPRAGQITSDGTVEMGPYGIAIVRMPAGHDGVGIHDALAQQ